MNSLILYVIVTTMLQIVLIFVRNEYTQMCFATALCNTVEPPLLVFFDTRNSNFDQSP